MNYKVFYLVLLSLFAQFSFSQEGIAVYSDYLSDNYYLLHPSMAGAANCAKLRVTARQQWFGQEDAPGMQTLSYNGRIGGEDSRSGMGVIVFNDKNGYHEQKGLKVTYAHHIMFSRDVIDLNQLSFGLSAGLIQGSLDETNFLRQGQYDPKIAGIVQNDSYFNVDFGMSYNYLDFYIHGTIKNAIETRREIYSEVETDNLRKFIVNAGYVFGEKENFMWEPSFMFQSVSSTNEKSFDANIKGYKAMDFGMLWGGLSYRRSLDGAEYLLNGKKEVQKLQYITPILGVNYKNYMFSYTYSYLTGDVKFDNGGFHQITLGLNLFCRKEKWHCNCPAVN
ncbi:MAG: type IX secretion system membrane protein PorP/SprF [Cyclobacteriaceae bacterium]|nr:type IX secretion system membrane protein PorP/SprF [Cyclobacteriaceae bacterium]